MCCGKLFKSLFSGLFYYLILCIFLLQLYAQYSTLVTLRTKLDNQKDGRNTMTNFQLSKSKHYDFNMNKVQEYFDDNALMQIPFLKKQAFNLMDYFNKREDKLDNRVYMYFYLIGYDIICTIIVYIFLFCPSIKAGFIKVIFQLLRFYYNAKRLQKFNSKMNLYEIIKSKWENMVLIRGWSIFNPEGFFIIEFLCNFVVILDIILLIKYIRVRRRYKRIKKMNQIVEEKDESVDENDKKEKKDDDKNDEINEKESNGESKSNDNNINIIKSDKGDLNILFDENDDVSQESSHNSNNIGGGNENQ